MGAGVGRRFAYGSLRESGVEKETTTHDQGETREVINRIPYKDGIGGYAHLPQILQSCRYSARYLLRRAP